MTKRVGLLFFSVAISTVLFLSSCGKAAATTSQPDTQPPPAPKLFTVRENITYGVVDGVELKMDIYYPESATKPLPAVLYVHGGGTTSYVRPTTSSGLRDPYGLLSRGYIVASIDYRSSPDYRFPASLEDVKGVVRFLRANASAYGIDANRIGAYGNGFGGYLVALLGVTDSGVGFEGKGGNQEESSRVRAVVDWYGPTDLTGEWGRGLRLLVFGVSEPEPELLTKASPITWVSRDDPPFLIMHGDMDYGVPLYQSEKFYERLVESGVPATLVVVKNAGSNGFTPISGDISPSRSEIIKMMGDFFDSHLK